MFEWFFSPYSGLLSGVELFLRNTPGCSAIEMLRILTLVLCGAVGARIAAHLVTDRRLRRRCPVYGPEEFAGLYALYQEAGALAGVLRLPPLHRHPDQDPLAFTTGFFRPAVFLAPVVARGLSADELRAVLVHELVHVRRRDNLRAWASSLLPAAIAILLLQATALYVLFFHVDLRFGFLQAGMLAAAVAGLGWTFRSVVWPRVIFQRELSCDDRVVETVKDPLVVASSLVRVWRLQRALPRRGAGWLHAHALVAARPSVEERVRRLIDYHPPHRFWWAPLRRALGIGALLWVSLFLGTYHGPDLLAFVIEVVPEIPMARR